MKAVGRSLVVGLAAIAIVWTVGELVPLTWGVRLFAALAWFSIPGIVLARFLYGKQAGWGAVLLAGPMWGYALSSIGLLGLWALGFRRFEWLLPAPVLALILVWPLRRLSPALSVPTFTRRDLAACAFVLLTVPAVVGLPFAHIGEDLPEGRAYRAYFTADFVWQMAVASEVAKGDMLPHNPYFANGPLHYYWLMHLFPAAVHRAAGEGLRLEQPLLINGVWSGLCFMAFLYFLTRHFVVRPWAASIACVGVTFCSSFEGIERIWTYMSDGQSFAAALDGMRVLNIDSITGWVYGNLRIDGLQRLLLYQPQHQSGYLLGFSALLLLVQARGPLTIGLLFLVGVFLALSFLMSPFGAGIFTVIAAACIAWRLVREKQWPLFLTGALAAGAPLAAAVGLGELLAYADPEAQVIAVGVNRLSLRSWPTAIFLSFGPVLIVAAAGVVVAIRQKMIGVLLPLLATVVTCFVFYFLVDVPDVQGVYVGFHVGKIAFAAFVPLCGLALQALWELRAGWRVLATTFTAAIAAAALPTVLIDIYNAQDIWNREGAPFGGNWTTILSPEELAGLDWIKRFTPLDARVQMEPIARERGAWAYIPAFAERRMSAGMPTSMVPLAKYQRVSDRVKGIYEARTAQEAHDGALAQCIDYLVVGDPERKAYPEFESVLASNVDLFRPAFRNGVLDVYAVQQARGRPGCSR